MKWRKAGQVVVEVILILPVFLAMVFCIMEIGYVSFRLILLNHGTYEAARIGGMLWTTPTGVQSVDDTMKRFLPTASIQCAEETTLVDPQSGQMNRDILCTARENVRLIFPLSSILLSKPVGTGMREITASVRMPVEQPLKK